MSMALNIAFIISSDVALSHTTTSSGLFEDARTSPHVPSSSTIRTPFTVISPTIGCPAIVALSFAFMFGVGYGGATPIYPAAAADLFMGGSFGLIFAVIFLGTGLGGSLGPYVSGLLRDVTGSYFLPLSLCVVALWGSTFLLWKSGPGKVRRLARPRREPVSPPS